MGIKDRIYSVSPRFLQNAYISLFGLRRQHLRYGGGFRNYLSAALETQWSEKEWFTIYQLKRLNILIKAAFNSDYYRSVFKKIGLDKERSLTSIEDIYRIPFLEKDVLRTNPASILAVDPDKERLAEFHTSGSTGTPLTVKMCLDDFRERMAYLERQFLWAGVSRRMKILTFTGRKIVGSSSDKVFWRYNAFGRQLLFSVYHLKETHKQDYIKKIIEYNPEIIEGYPSALSVIASWILDSSTDVSLKSLKAVFATAETLTHEQRSIIENAFKCKVINYYASNEGAPFITQCEFGKLHINPETGIFEFLKPDGNRAGPGEIAEIVVTSFTTRAMPLIRYKIGDSAILSRTESCECGRNMPIVDEIVGRTDDIFETPYRGFVGRLSTSLKLLPSVAKEAQIQQHSPEHFVLLIATEVAITESELKVIRNDLTDKLGPVKIEIRFVKEIPRGPNGKFRSQIKVKAGDES